MPTINIDMSDPEKLKHGPPVCEVGIHEFTIKNRVGLVPCKPPSVNSMAKLELTIFIGDVEYIVYTQLVQVKGADFKWYQLFRSVGYDDAQITAGVDLADLQGLSGKCEIGQEIYQGNPKARVNKFLYEDADAPAAE